MSRKTNIAPGDLKIIWRADDEDNLRAYRSDDVNFEDPITWAPQPGSQSRYLSCPVREVLYEGTRGPGKASANTAKILTPSGWQLMGDINVGDVVCTPKLNYATGTHKTAEITHLYEFPSKPIFTVTFSDGAKTQVCDEHLWKYRIGYGGWRLDTTADLQEHLSRGNAPIIPLVDAPENTHLGILALRNIVEQSTTMGNSYVINRDAYNDVLRREAWRLGIPVREDSYTWYIDFDARVEDKVRALVSVEFAGNLPARCIRIDDPDHLYVTDDYIVTHNTDALLMDYAQHVDQGYAEDWRGIIFRRTYPELKDIIAKSTKWFKKIFPEARYNRSQHEWRFPEGEVLIFGFAETVEDYNKYHGQNFPYMAWEELTNWPDLALYKKMMSLNRSSNKAVPVKYRATTNPGGIGHNAVKRRFNLPCPPGMMHTGIIKTPGEPDRIAIRGTLSENKILLHAQPDYEDTLRASCDTEAERKAWIDGSWDITAGGMFDDVWNPETHVVVGLQPKDIPHNWRIDRSYDHGQSHPFSVGWWAESNGEPMELPDGRLIGHVRGDLIRIAEWYGWTGEPNRGLRLTAKEIAQGIRDRQRNMGIDSRVHPGVADGSIFDKYDGGQSVSKDMAKFGVTWRRADKSAGSRKQGWQQCRTRLKGAESSGGKREEPGLFISHTCTQFIRTFPILPRDMKDPDDVDTASEDHIADEARYRCRKKKPNITMASKG